MAAELSDIQHPLEGISYLIVLAIFVRWTWPLSWNKFLQAISADVSGKSNFEE